MTSRTTRRLRGMVLVSTVMLLACALADARARAIDAEEAGQVIAMVGDRRVGLPLLKSDYRVAVEGTMATVTLKQTFLNPTGVPLNATYLFPLNQKAAVYAMTMEVGDEIVRAVIQRKEDAMKTFEKAKAEGKAAALLEQHRPNMFTQNIANLMPDLPITVTLKYVQQVPKVDGAYELVVPMVVGPRYEGRVPRAVAEDLGLEIDGDVVVEAGYDPDPAPLPDRVSGWNIARVPAYPGVIGQDAPASIDPKRVGFALSLKSPTPISGVSSTTHDLAIAIHGKDASASFAKGRDIDNRDLVVRYEIADETDVAAGVVSHYDDRGGFLSLQIEPPKIPAESSVTPRELVFVLDTSGSMGGEPMEASKTFMRAALENLRPTDYFRILRFSNSTAQFNREAVPATDANIRSGQRFVSGLTASGGTELNAAMNAAFDLPHPANTVRIVVFLTDGYIGGDRQVIETVAKRIGNARVYAFGVGSSVNRYLLEGMAREGRGRARFVEVGESAAEAARALAANLDAPLLTDISIDWNGLAVEGQSPARIPDLFAGGSVGVLARYTDGGTHRITVIGLVNGRPASMPLDVTLAAKPEDGQASGDSALPLVWAREQIFDKTRQYTISGGADTALREAITQLGLAFSLQTDFTSFVAVSERVYNETPGATPSADVPLPQAAGVPTSAYPTLNVSGSSAPEPGTIFAMVAAVLMVLARFWRRILATLGLRIGRTRSEPRLEGLPKRLLNDGWWLQ